MFVTEHCFFYARKAQKNKKKSYPETYRSTVFRILLLIFLLLQAETMSTASYPWLNGGTVLIVREGEQAAIACCIQPESTVREACQI